MDVGSEDHLVVDWQTPHSCGQLEIEQENNSPAQVLCLLSTLISQLVHGIHVGFVIAEPPPTFGMVGPEVVNVTSSVV